MKSAAISLSRDQAANDLAACSFGIKVIAGEACINFPLFAIILRIRAFLAASTPTHWTPVHGLILF